MNNSAQIASVLFNAAGLAALWYFVVLWRGYKTDKLRQDLFGLRAELFDYAVQHDLSFSNRSYVQLRGLLNGMIRFAHELSLLRFVITALLEKFRPMTRNVPNLVAEIDSDPELLNAQREYLKLIHNRLAVLVIVQIVTTSVFGPAAIFLFQLYAKIRGNGVQTETRKEASEQMLSDRRVRYGVRLIEQQAVEDRKLHDECLLAAGAR